MASVWRARQPDGLTVIWPMHPPDAGDSVRGIQSRGLSSARAGDRLRARWRSLDPKPGIQPLDDPLRQ
jgi:hypothetical protein